MPIVIIQTKVHKEYKIGKKVINGSASYIWYLNPIWEDIKKVRKNI